MPTVPLYYWKCQKCGQIFERVSRGEPRRCPMCRDNGAKTFVREERHYRCGAKIIATYSPCWGMERGKQPTVEDMDRRCAELLFYSDGERTFGAIRAKLIAEFGEELFNAAASR